MSVKKTTRKQSSKSKDITSEFIQNYTKNFNCSDIKLKRQFPMNHNHTEFYHLTQSPKTNMVFVDGVAGSMKTYLAVYGALELLCGDHVDKIIYIRSVVESSSRSIGYLKGDEDEKFGPYAMPLMDKLQEVLDVSNAKALFEHGYVKAIPVNFTRGLTFNNSVVILDETQNMTRSEITTILTRFGRHSKYIVCGDTHQSDIRESGFKGVFDAFNTEWSEKNNIYCVKFGPEDIVRSQILKHITQVLGV